MRQATLAAIAAAAASILLLSGCASSSDGLADTYGEVAEQDYFSSDGAFSFIASANRGNPITFEGMTDMSGPWSSSDFMGEPVVVNFWFAGCPPCRLEAKDLAELHEQFSGDGVAFIGVNILDGPETAITFAREFGISYPSLMDVESGMVRLAFAGEASPNAVPTTVVLDRDHRVAARVNGLITDVALLETMINDVLAETPEPTA
jgi:thiol-disulfide isomerase/thioredoxin